MVFFFYGPNTFASRRKLQAMVQTYTKKTGSDLGLERINGSETNLNQLMSALEAVPFLASSRLVIIEDLSRNKAVAATVDKIVPLVPSSTVAVFYETEVDQRTAYFKYLRDHAQAVKFEPLSTPQLKTWVRQEVRRAEAEIDPPALNRLLDLAGEDQWRLEQEILKLASYQPKINVAAVEELVVASPRQNIFDLVEAMVAGRTGPALQIYRQLLADRVSPHYVLTMVAWQLRNLLLAKTAGAVNSSQLAKQASLSPYVAGKVLDRQRDYSEEVLKTAFLSVIQTDLAIKTGQGEAEVLVENLIGGLSAQERV